MLLQFSRLSTLIKQSAPFSESPFTRHSVTQRVENNYLQLKSMRDKSRSRWSSGDLSLATLRWVQARLIKILTAAVVLSKRSWPLLSSEEGSVPPAIAFEGRATAMLLVTVKFVVLKTLQTVHFKCLAEQGIKLRKRLDKGHWSFCDIFILILFLSVLFLLLEAALGSGVRVSLYYLRNNPSLHITWLSQVFVSPYRSLQVALWVSPSAVPCCWWEPCKVRHPHPGLLRS